MEHPPPTPAPNDPSASLEQSMAWARQMRLLYSPPGMCLEDGTIDQAFFKPAKVIVMNDKKWGEAENELLEKGVKKHGVGGWRQIREEFLPSWDEHSIRIKTSRRLGIQNLERYRAVQWRGGKDDMARELAKNKAIGEKLGCWKGGILVENDTGALAAYWKRVEEGLEK